MTSPDDPARIARRDAMRAALAGASLAALSEPPRIVSLSVAPDVGQARTPPPCTPGSRTIVHPILEPRRQCWGRWLGDVCSDLVAPDAVYGSFTLGLTIGGTDTRGAAGGHATVNVGGLTGNGTCLATLTADCVPPVIGLPTSAGDVRSPANGTPIARTLSENGTHVLGPWSCTGRWPDSVTITVSCRCPNVNANAQYPYGDLDAFAVLTCDFALTAAFGLRPARLGFDFDLAMPRP